MLNDNYVSKRLKKWSDWFHLHQVLKPDNLMSYYFS